MHTTQRTTKPAPESLPWLMARNRTGQIRIRTLSWGRLARIYQRSGRDIRHAIEREARRLGYRPEVVLGLNEWK